MTRRHRLVLLVTTVALLGLSTGIGTDAGADITTDRPANIELASDARATLGIEITPRTDRGPETGAARADLRLSNRFGPGVALDVTVASSNRRVRTTVPPGGTTTITLGPEWCDRTIDIRAQADDSTGGVLVQAERQVPCDTGRSRGRGGGGADAPA